MTKAYFWKTLFTYKEDPSNMKLLDLVDELYDGERKNVRTIYHDTAFNNFLDKENQFSEKIKVPASEFVEPYDWVRVSADVYFKNKEWNLWDMTQFIAEFKVADKSITNQRFRIQNLVAEDKQTRVYLDVRKPDQAFTDLEILFWNPGGNKPIDITDLEVELFSRVILNSITPYY